MKLPPEKHELSEEEKEALEAEALEVQLFEQYEMPVFLRLLEAHADLEPADALYGLSAVFWYGWAGWAESTGGQLLHARTPGEVAKVLYDRCESGHTTYVKVAEGLRACGAYARHRK